jgi:hypothetical protein
MDNLKYSTPLSTMALENHTLMANLAKNAEGLPALDMHNLLVSYNKLTAHSSPHNPFPLTAKGTTAQQMDTNTPKMTAPTLSIDTTSWHLIQKWKPLLNMEYNI